MYAPNPARYDTMEYRRCGRSGLMLPAITLGLWHNFGGDIPCDLVWPLCRTAFDLGINHFDLANNYGPPPGAAEKTFGRILREDFKGLRDELLISSKAGYRMWGGPYGEWGSRKYLIASCDQSLKRMGLDYVDIFYSHRFDPNTPLEETMGALDTIVRSGRALYAGISSYTSDQTAQAAAILRDLGTPCLIHQPRYSILGRWTEKDRLLDRLETEAVGCIAFSPLAQGLLSSNYLHGIPEGSRAAATKSLSPEVLNDDAILRLRGLNELAKTRGQTLSQMAIAYVLRDARMTSALVGASRPEQIVNSVGALGNLGFSPDELAHIDRLAFESEDW